MSELGARRMRVILATLGVLDHDHDILVPGLMHRAEVPATILGAHEFKAVPLGRSLIREVNGTLQADLDFNTSGPGEDWFRALTHDFRHEWPSVQEFSFAFRVLEHESGLVENQRVRFLKKIAIFECSPVVMGASINSGTPAIADGKAASDAIEVKVSRPVDGHSGTCPHLQRAIGRKVAQILRHQREDVDAPRGDAPDAWLQRLQRKLDGLSPAQEVWLMQLRRRLAGSRGGMVRR
jgi:hypothetical protein